MKLRVKFYDKGKNKVVVTPMSDTEQIDHDVNARALLVFLKERVPINTLMAFGMLIRRETKKRHFQVTIYEAYEDVFPPDPPAPKYKTVEIEADLLKFIKEHCPQAIKER